ncbi:MAG TPA: alkaline phosphatase PafA [Phnomibacter sp.]|nr:alkaline phosphatase PafA [Phnomibacter sp.]
MNKFSAKPLAVLMLLMVLGFQQFTTAQPYNGKRPKLVVGLVVDQMRWDFLYRYYSRYGEGGFKRLIAQGFSAENTLIPYAQSITAPGHACVYTGSTPAINGIVGNDWFDAQQGKGVYCVEDDSVQIVGGVANSDPMSPKNLFATTITDELRLATNFQSKVVGVAIKDRGAILPAGHTGTAYWYEGANGSFVSSTWYMNALPAWAQDFNNKKLVDEYYKKNWNTLYPVDSYTLSDIDNNPYEGRTSGDAAPVFPHDLQRFIGKDYGAIRSTPYGNTLTLDFAKEALKAEKLGADAVTDFLAVSLSSTDYIGHQYGPNSIEIEDTYLRLDKDLAEFFKFLDAEVGKNEYVFFITADHGVAHVPAYLSKHNIKVSTVTSTAADINRKVLNKFGVPSIIRSFGNSQVYLNYRNIDSVGKNANEIADFIAQELKKLPYMLDAFSYHQVANLTLSTMLKEKFLLGFNPARSGDIQIVLKPGYFYGGNSGTTHGTMYPYDAHIPMVFMGWGITPGRTNRVTYMTDISATLAALLHIQMPSGSIGSPIVEILPQH